MAKRKSNKSAAVREALTADPTKSAAAIAKELRVTPSLVYNVKAAIKKNGKTTNGKKTKGKPGRKPGQKSAARVTAPESAHNALDSAFEFVTKVGGLLHAEQLLAKLRTIKERL